MKKIVTMDIGNTNVVCGVFQGKRLLREYRIATKVCKNPARCRAWLKGILPNNKEIAGGILCSVVPWCTRSFKRAFTSLRLPLKVVGETVRCPIKNLYKNPKQVGPDRLVNAYAALRVYGAPAIVVDFGTAITVDIVSKKGEYLGGMIVPGMGISLEALAEKTALLPKVRLRPPKLLLGKDTEGSILSGAFHGFASLCDGLVTKIRKKFGSRIKTILTGGHSRIVSSYCKEMDYVNGHLTLEGLRLLFERVYPTEE
ncbi:MAG: type III pantothenate kinase [Candidatus Omnitrophica bacterium]|nr:type III pantothenate kinase [Candidatus Omnitrophota bacterium]